MLDQVVEIAAGLHDVRRQVEHIDVALVDGDDARGRVVHHQALDHVVERGVEPVPFRFQPLLCLAALPGHLPDDEEQDQRDRRCRQDGGADQEPGLGLPIGQRGGYRICRDDDDREAAQLGRGPEPVPAVDRAFDAQRLLTALRQDTLQQRRRSEFLSDQVLGARMSRQQGAVGVKHRNGSVRSDRNGSKELHVIGRIDAPRHHAEKDTIFAGQSMSNDRVQAAADKAAKGLGLDRR